ncbi:MAG: hypothetical protein WB676_24785 [Bryobacteraceae bacterium]
MSAEPLEDDNPIEEILLHGFPNPERVGCPPPETIQALGERRIGRDDPAWSHIWHCSPCFADFKKIRDNRLAEIEGAEKRAARKHKLSIWSAAAVGCACLIAVIFISVNHLRATIVPIDLTNAPTYRGETQDDGPVLATLPKKLDELHVTLPLLSPPGQYVLAILKSRSENAAIALGSATAVGNGPKVTLVIKLDLSAAKPGRYYLATRREEQGQETAAYYYPVLIRGG